VVAVGIGVPVGGNGIGVAVGSSVAVGSDAALGPQAATIKAATSSPT